VSTTHSGLKDKPSKSSDCYILLAGVLLGLYFDHEHGGNTLLQNTELVITTAVRTSIPTIIKNYKILVSISETFKHTFSLFTCLSVFTYLARWVPIAVAARSKAWTVFARSNAGIVGRGMDVCVSLFCVYVVLCVGSDLATGSSLIQGVLPTVYRIKNLKEWPRSNKGL
jgi:hypothetical protein